MAPLTPEHLLRIREYFGLSQAELAGVLGFGPNGEQIVRSWESGVRGGAPFSPTPLARLAIDWLYSLVATYRAMPEGVIKNRVRQTLPEILR